MQDFTMIFAKYAIDELRTYGTPKYDNFAEICDKMINGDNEAKSVVNKIIRFTQIDILKQECLYIDFKDLTLEYKVAYEVIHHHGDLCQRA